MAKLTFKKSYTFRERYSEIVGFDQTIAVFETGIGGKKRLVKHLDRRWPDEEYKISDFPSYGEDDDKYGFHFICMNRAKEVVGKDIPINYNTITNFSRWTPLGVDKKSSDKAALSNINFLKPKTEIDKKFAQYVQGSYPPYYEILKTGGSSSIQLVDEKNDIYQAVREDINTRRKFSSDKYYFNNGAEIDIQWIDYQSTYVYAGDRYSNNWGEQMDPRDLGLKDVKAPTEYKKNVRIILPENERKEGEPYWFTLVDKLTVFTQSTGQGIIDIKRKKEELGFSFLKYSDITYEFIEDDKGNIIEVSPPMKIQKEWEGIVKDEDILKEILKKWQQKYKNSRLQIATNSWGYYSIEPTTTTVEWLLPTDDFNLGTGSSGPNGPSGPSVSIATNTVELITSSYSEPIKGSYIFDVRNKNIMFSKELGELIVVEKEEIDPFIFSDIETDLLESEYSEDIFAGDEDLKETYNEYLSQISEVQNISNEEKTEIAKEMIKYKPGKPSKNPPADVIKAMKDYGITNPLEQAHFLAQCAHESGQFQWKREFASGKAYEGRSDLGNNKPGDGVRYKGRGYIQITGKANYISYNSYLKSKGINDDVVANPELLEGKFAADCSVWFWSVAGPKGVKNFPKKAKEGATDDVVTRISRWVNGGDNGLSDRKEKFRYYWSVLQQNKTAYS